MPTSAQAPAPELHPSSVEALEYQSQVAANLVVANGRKHPCRCNRAWKASPASWETVWNHLQNCENAHVGIVPWTVKATVLDLDRGDVSDVVAFAEPRLLIPSHQEGRAHLWYPDNQPRPNADWSIGSAGGEVRGANGYAIQTYRSDSPLRIADEIVRPRLELDRVDLFSFAGIELSTSGETALKIDIRSYRDMVDGDGRNSKLFNDLREWARVEIVTHHDKESFRSSVAAMAHRLNGFFSEPEEHARVRSVIVSVTDWVWERRNGWVFESLAPELRSLGGRRSGSRRRAQRDAFDGSVGRYLRAGYDVASIAAFTGRHERTVYQAKARVLPRIDSTESNSRNKQASTESNSRIATKSVTPKAGAAESNYSVVRDAAPAAITHADEKKTRVFRRTSDDVSVDEHDRIRQRMSDEHLAFKVKVEEAERERLEREAYLARRRTEVLEYFARKIEETAEGPQNSGEV